MKGGRVLLTGCRENWGAFFPVEQALIVWTVAAMASSALIGAVAILMDFHGFCDVLMSLYYWLFKNAFLKLQPSITVTRHIEDDNNHSKIVSLPGNNFPPRNTFFPSRLAKHVSKVSNKERNAAFQSRNRQHLALYVGISASGFIHNILEASHLY